MEQYNPNKRRKTQLACHPCRARKTGCDGRRPHCTSCIIRGWQERCGYQDKEPHSPGLTISDLDRRLRRLEDGPRDDSETPSRRIDGHGASYSSVTTVVSSGTPESVARKQILANPSPQQSPHFSDSYGPPSNSAFVRDVASVAAGSGGVESALLGPLIPSETERPFHSPIGFSIPQPRATVSGMKDMILPPRHLADSLLHVYWELIHPLLPIIHRPSFTDQFERLWQPSDATSSRSSHTFENTVFLATLNVVMALCCQRNESYSLEEREDLGEEFYGRSQKLISMDTFNHYSLSIVQLFVLRGLYLLYSPYAERCWTVTSVATGAAQCIGLDTLKLQLSPSDQVTSEMRRRVWYGCMNLDRLVGYAFGKPLRLPRASAVPLPAEIDDEYLSASKSGSQPVEIPSKLTYFIWTLKLTVIGDKIVDVEKLNSQKGARSFSSRELGVILDISSEMDHFLAQLPSHLRVDAHRNGADHQPCFEMQAGVLKARVLYIRLAMLRPFLLGEVAQRIKRISRSEITTTGRIDDGLREDMCRLCISTAHDVLEVLHRALPMERRTSPWHALVFTFAAASVLVAATLWPDFELRLDDGLGKASWSRVTQIFQFHSRHVASAEKGLEALEWFRKCMAARTAVPDSSNAAETSTAEEMNVGNVRAPGSLNPDSTFDFDPNWIDQSPYDFGELLDSDALDISWFTSQSSIF